MPRSRRRVLALSATLLSAGCLGSWTDTSGRQRTDADPPSTTDHDPTGTTDGCTAGVNVRTAAFDPVGDVPEPLDAYERDIVAEAVSNGSAEYTTYAQAPLSAGVFVTHDDAFYRVDYTVAATENVPAFLMDVAWERGQEAPTDATVLAFDDLPVTDRNALETAVLNPEHEGLPQQQLSVREYPAPYPGGDDSRLVGNVTWVRWRDRTFRVEVAGASESTQERRTFRYATEQVASTPEEFRQFVAERYVVSLDGLPDDQAAIVESAMRGGYEECKPLSSAFDGLRERLADEPRPDGIDVWYVAFDGQRFGLEIYGWVH